MLRDAGIVYFEEDGDILLELDDDYYYGPAPDIGAFESLWTAYFGCSDEQAVSYNPNLEFIDDQICIYEVPEDAIVINELMIRPILDHNDFPADASYEYIELYNASEYPINLYNWSLVNANGSAITLADEALMAYSNHYTLLARSEEEIFLDDANLVVDYVYTGPTLIPNNTSDAIILKDDGDNTIDSLSYSIESGFPIEEALGKSLELIRPEYDNSNSGVFINPADYDSNNNILYANVRVQREFSLEFDIRYFANTSCRLFSFIMEDHDQLLLSDLRHSHVSCWSCFPWS